MDVNKLGRISRIMAYLACFVVVSCFVFSCATLSRVEKIRSDFRVTEKDFAQRVDASVQNFLSNYLARVSQEPEKEQDTLQVRQEFLEEFYTYYRYSNASWVAVVHGSKFVSGDYFDSGLVINVGESRMYVQGNDGIVVYRPRKVGADAQRQRGAARPPRPETDAPLD